MPTARHAASMGPRSFNRGNRCASAPSTQLEPWLQWGRGLSTAEMPTGASATVPPHAASMGPRSFNRGNVRTLLRSAASTQTLASMGPRSFNRGNGRAGHRSRLTSTRFNGAAVIQPRKCWPIGQPGIATGASMGPRSFNRGNADRGQPIGRAASDGFNGAAVIQPRKCGTVALHASRRSTLQWGRGHSTAEMPRPAMPSRASELMLQWGRGHSTAEMRRATGDIAARRAASMGPRSFNRGNAAAVAGSRTATVQLQWGRGHSTAEMPCTAGTCRGSATRFNGAAVIQPRKSSSRSSVP